MKHRHSKRTGKAAQVTAQLPQIALAPTVLGLGLQKLLHEFGHRDS